MLRISDVIKLAMVSRKTIYNAINTGRLQYELVNMGNRQVRIFHEDAVFQAFPRAKSSRTHEQEMEELRQEIASLKFALNELRKAINALEPSDPHIMTQISNKNHD